MGDRGLLQPSSERAVESMLPDVLILEKVEHFGLLVELLVHSDKFLNKHLIFPQIT